MTVRLNGIVWSAVLSLVGMVLAILGRLAMLQQRPERKWYDGRAAAESAKTLAWRFAVCGEPFSRRISEHDAVTEFSNVVMRVTRDLPSLDYPAGDSFQITQWMRTVRAETLRERQATYEKLRLAEQQVWYSDKARYNASRATKWTVTLLSAEGLAVILAICRAVDVTSVDIAGLVATFSAIGVAWSESRQHETLSRAYSIASQEIAAIRSKLRGSMSESEWSKFVSDAEEAISREHTLWVAARSTPFSERVSRNLTPPS
jgi:hypothetical protein